MVGLGDGLADVRLGQPEQGLLDRLPLVGTDQHRTRRAVLGDDDLIGGRHGVHHFAELVKLQPGL